jgi:hypothetical protein
VFRVLSKFLAETYFTAAACQLWGQTVEMEMSPDHSSPGHFGKVLERRGEQLRGSTSCQTFRVQLGDSSLRSDRF